MNERLNGWMEYEYILVQRLPVLPLGQIHLKSYCDTSMHVPPNKHVVNVHGLKIRSVEELEMLKERNKDEFAEILPCKKMKRHNSNLTKVYRSSSSSVWSKMKLSILEHFDNLDMKLRCEICFLNLSVDPVSCTTSCNLVILV